MPVVILAAAVMLEQEADRPPAGQQKFSDRPAERKHPREWFPDGFQPGGGFC